MNATQQAVANEVDHFMQGLKKRNPFQDEFHQSVLEIVESVMPWYMEHSKFRDAQILERTTEPDRVISFRVIWQRDNGEVRANRAWRVQFNHTLGPYKGGLRFHPSVTESVLKFLGYEQIFKNSLTGLPMGGAKGGSNFNPKGKSDAEVMRFCQSMMTELVRYVGEDVDVPAGDIGVGGREISYLFGQYMRLENRWSGVLTGKGETFGGSAIRTEATGYGCVYFCAHMLGEHGHSISGKSVAVSGSGNVALYAAQKAIDSGAKVLTLSDSGGFVHFADGLNRDDLDKIIDFKTNQRGRLEALQSVVPTAQFRRDEKPWRIACDIALPCATQNELDVDDAKLLHQNQVLAVCEGANMPLTAKAAHFLHDAQVLHAPGKASNAGGVAVSGLEQSQNAMRLSWTRDEVDSRLQAIMTEIHRRCVEHGKDQKSDQVDYVKGANIAGLERVANAMLAHGVV